MPLIYSYSFLQSGFILNFIHAILQIKFFPHKKKKKKDEFNGLILYILYWASAWSFIFSQLSQF